jgi:hypothetical protein
MLSSSYFTLVPIGLVLFIYSVRRLQAWHHRRTFEAANSCQPIPHLSRFRNLVEQVKAIKSHTYLEMWNDRYAKIGKTFSSATMSIDQIIFTIDPENIKTILATDFTSFELGQRRRTLMGPVIGPGIFSNDGAAWKHSRVFAHMMKSCNTHHSDAFIDAYTTELQQIDNMRLFEIRVSCAGFTQSATGACCPFWSS